MLRECPYCGSRVYVKEDGICPSCRRQVSPASPPPRSTEPPSVAPPSPAADPSLVRAPSVNPDWSAQQRDEAPKSFNPFAPPAPEVLPTWTVSQFGDITVRGKQIEGRTPLMLPERCFCCNNHADLDNRIRKKMVWAPPWIYVSLVVCGLPGLLVTYLITRKTLNIEYSLCHTCAGSRRTRVMICAGAWIASGALLAGVIVFEVPELALLLVPMLIGSLVATYLASWPVKLRGWRQPGLFLINGAGDEFLHSLQTNS